MKNNLISRSAALVSTENPALCRLLAENPAFVASTVFATKRSRAHKFRVSQKCRLVGLESFPEHNGEIVEIETVREDGPCGRAYYIKGRIADVAINWVYEYRLEAIE